MGLREIIDLRNTECFRNGGMIKAIAPEDLEGVGEIKSILHHVIGPGRVRGNHWHKLRHELIYVSGGKVILYLKDGRTGEEHSGEIYPGRKFEIPAFVAHAFYNPYQKTANILEISNRDYEKDDVFGAMICDKEALSKTLKH